MRANGVKRSIRTRLTAAGWGFVLLMAFGFMMAVNYSNNLIFAMTFLLMGIALVGWWQTRSNITQLSFQHWLNTPVFSGQPVDYRLLIENPIERPRFGLSADSDDLYTSNEILIEAGGQAELNISRISTKRGWLSGQRAGISSRFPLGIFKATCATSDLPRTLIYPAAVGKQDLSQAVLSQQAHRQQESGSFTSMRRYAPGDPPSRIAWQALARTDEVYIKEFDGAQGQSAISLNWDAVIATGVEEKLAQLCRWVLDAHAQGSEYSLVLPGLVIDAANDDSHQRKCLKALALYGMPSGDKT